MLTRATLLRAILCTATIALASNSAQAQTFPIPGKPVRIVVPFPAGGQTDIQARLLASKMQGPLGTTVLVDNKPGASSILARWGWCAHRPTATPCSTPSASPRRRTRICSARCPTTRCAT